MSNNEYRVVNSTDGRAKMTFFLVNIVSSQVIAHRRLPDDEETSASIHLRGSKLQHTMWEITNPLDHASTVLNFCSTGSTTITVRGNYQLRTRASLDFAYHQGLAFRKRRLVLLPFSTNNLNYAGRLYGVLNPLRVKECLCKYERCIVDKNDKFPSIKFNIKQEDSDEEKVCFQLFVPKMCINTQYQTWESLEKSSRKMLDIILRYAEFDENLCNTCVQKEVCMGRRLCKDEVDAFNKIHS